MIENALIEAIERAADRAKVTFPENEAESEGFSKQLTEELDALTKPDDPMRSLSALEYWLRATVANVTLDKSELERLRQLYALLVQARSAIGAEGAIGFLLCCRSADQAQSLKTGRSSLTTGDTSERVKDALADSSSFLANPSVRKWIAGYYAFDEVKLVDQYAKATMIASGTTSYVIRYTGSEDFVVKLVKPQFMASRIIRDQTSSYGNLLRAQAESNAFLPRVYKTGNAYIQMEFIDGKSLADLMETGALDAMTTTERRELIFGIIGNLEALQSPHLDLSPGNIMVESLPVGSDKVRRFKVRLIDFGYNYLLREGLSGLPIRSDIVRYSAPEMMAGSYEGSIKADLYSLGILVLEIMRSSSNAVDLSVQLDRCWQSQPQLAAIVEELIAEDPADRAPWTNELDQPSTYRTLRRRLEQEERIAKLVDARVDVTDAWSAQDGPIRELIRIIREAPTLWRLEANDELSADARYLYAWSGIINFFLVTSLAICGYMLIFETIDLSSFMPAEKFSISAWLKSAGLLYEKLKTLVTGSPDAQAVLAGQALALTIILVVSQYYNSIFSSITVRSIRGPVAQRAEFTIRATPFGIMVLCVLTAVWFPSWWFVTSLIGPLITAANNYCVLRFCQSVRQEAGRRKIVGNLETTDIARFDEMFERWPKAMMYTGFLIFAVGVLLRSGIIGDEAFIGLAMAFLCYSALYQSASTDMSALVRGGIRRYVKVAERAQTFPGGGLSGSGQVGAS